MCVFSGLGIRVLHMPSVKNDASLAALMVTSSILRWILQAFSNSFSRCCVTPAIFKSASMGGLSYKAQTYSSSHFSALYKFKMEGCCN